jgi:4'-phosphopantetheinyl transferase
MSRQEQDKGVLEIQFIQPDEYSWDLDNEVHVWKFPVVSTGFSFLTPEEKIIAGRFRLEGDRNRFAIGRQALRFIISRYLSIEPMDISVIAEPGRKPVINYPVTEIHFNISHSGEWVLIAIAHNEQGIDVEKIDPEFDYVNLLEDHFNETEKSFIAESTDPVSAFYYLWTRKEALTKAWGTGLLDYMNQVSVLNMDFLSDLDKKKWKIKSFHVSVFYPAALAYSGNPKMLRYFDGGSTFRNFINVQKK